MGDAAKPCLLVPNIFAVNIFCEEINLHTKLGFKAAGIFSAARLNKRSVVKKKQKRKAVCDIKLFDNFLLSMAIQIS